MTIGDLLFILLFLATVVGLVAALVMAVRRSGKAARLLRVLGIVWVVYLAVVFVVAAATPQQVVPFGQDLCFDDMCFAVVQARTVPELFAGGQAVRPGGSFTVVTVRVSNHGRGRAQRELGIRPRLWHAGESFDVSAAGQKAWDESNGSTPRLTDRVQAGESFLSDAVFDVPAGLTDAGLTIDHGFTPGDFVIGESPLLHKPTILRLTH